MIFYFILWELFKIEFSSLTVISYHLFLIWLHKPFLTFFEFKDYLGYRQFQIKFIILIAINNKEFKNY